jgi:hypothetical protein
LYFNPANMMAKLSSDIVSSIETALESPDVKSMFLAMDNQTWLAILVYGLVFWVGMFVAVASDDMKVIVPPDKKRQLIPVPTATPPASYAKYTRVATNTKTAWNMENERRQQQQKQQVERQKATDEAVAAMWERREKVRTVITYERAATSSSFAPPALSPMAVVASSTHFTTPAPAAPAMIDPPPASSPAVMSPPPAPAVYARHPAAVSSSAPPAAAPAMTSAQYMAGLGSSGAGKQSYAISGPNYSNNIASSSRRRSYDMVKWTPATPVAITSLYLANMSGPDRPALGSYTQVPVYFSPGVIPELKQAEEEETYYYSNEPQKQPAQEEYYEYDDYEEDDYYDDLPQGKGSGYHHHYQSSYAPTRWKPDMRVNESGPGASRAYLSNMRQPVVNNNGYYASSSSSSTSSSTSHRFAANNNDDESNVYANGRMNGFPSELLSNASVPGDASALSSSPFGTVANGLSNGEANGVNAVVANEQSYGSMAKESSPLEDYLKSASATGGANGAATADPYYGMSTWQPSPYASSENDERASTMAASGYSPPALSEPPALYQPSFATAAAHKPPQKKSYSMTSWKPGSVTPVQGSAFAGNSYLAAINSVVAGPPSSPSSTYEKLSGSDNAVPLEFHQPPAPAPYRPSFSTSVETAASSSGGATSKKSYSMSKWQPGSPASTNAALGNSYLSAMSSSKSDENSRDESPAAAYQPSAPSPFQAVNTMSSWSPATASTLGSAFGVTSMSSMSSSDPESLANPAPMFSQPPAPIPYQSSTANGVKASKKSYNVSRWKPDAQGSDNSRAVNLDGARPPSFAPPAVPERPAPSPYQPTFASMPASYANRGAQTRQSDSIIENAYFNGMGSMYGNAEAPRSSPPPRLYQNPPPFGNESLQNFNGSSRSREDEDSRRSPAGPPVWGVAESETPKRVQQMQMQS